MFSRFLKQKSHLTSSWIVLTSSSCTVLVWNSIWVQKHFHIFHLTWIIYTSRTIKKPTQPNTPGCPIQEVVTISSRWHIQVNNIIRVRWQLPQCHIFCPGSHMFPRCSPDNYSTIHHMTPREPSVPRSESIADAQYMHFNTLHALQYQR